MKKCNVCENKFGTYKCSRCLICYCSVTCYGKHKNTKCEAIETSNQCSKESTISKKDEESVSFCTADTVPEERLKSLGESKELKILLANPHLQDLLKLLDSTPDAEELIQKLMLEPLFVEFVDATLKVIDPVSEKDCETS